jgi:hypothetical protein
MIKDLEKLRMAHDEDGFFGASATSVPGQRKNASSFLVHQSHTFLFLSRVSFGRQQSHYLQHLSVILTIES